MAAAARELGARMIVPGASLREVCAGVEDEIRRRGAEPAFPTQSSLNDVAAHYCPSPEDETLYAEGDLAKLDIGVHIDGYVVDTALTVNLGDRRENRRLVEAAREALEAAIAVAGPGVPVRRVSEAIESALRRFAARPMRTLCGHHVGRWTVHCPPPIPNVPEDSPVCLALDAVVAIEPFATDGSGFVAEGSGSEVFRVLPGWDDGVDLDPAILETLRRRRGLPFSRRDLLGFPRPLLEETLARLRRRGALADYPPLLEMGGHPVAQAEHTLYLGPNGVEVLTR